MKEKLYTGYVYIWYDTVSKFFYIGGHYGSVEDRYICSNKIMKRAYILRPESFRFKVLEYTNSSTNELRIIEQKWLDKIKDSELMLSDNVRNKTCRYYNVKKNATGGNGLGTNKGNSNIGGHNKGKPMSEEQRLKLSIAHSKPKSQKWHESRKKKIEERKNNNGS